MATPSERLPQNASGKYYVDSTCIDCDQCRSMAPQMFVRHDETGLAFVQRQPQTDEEVALAEEVLAGCASGSIGNDGA